MSHSVGLALLVSVMATPIMGQEPPVVRLGVRAEAAVHPWGLRLESPEYSWQHRMEPAPGIGATLSISPGGTRWGGRIDVDYLPRVKLDADPGHIRLSEEESSSLYWIAGSVKFSPTAACSNVCGSASAGYGVGRYSFPQRELRGGIVNSVAEPQTTGVWRFGIDLRAPAVSRNLTLQISDYIGSLETLYSGDHLTAMHVLMIGIGVGM